MDLKQAKEARDFFKLIGVGAPYVLKLGETELTVWMRNMTAIEAIHCGQLFAENYDALKEKGADHAGGAYAGRMAMQIQTLLYCLQKEEGGEPLFSNPREVLQLNGDTRNQIYIEFVKRYELSEDELGNLLRERIGTLTTKSNSPAISPEPIHSEPNPPNGQTPNA